MYPPPLYKNNRFVALACALFSFLAFSCSELQTLNDLTSISIRIPVEQIASASSARAVAWSEDPSVYSVEVTLYVNGVPEMQSAEGTLLQLSQKTFSFKKLSVGASAKVESQITQNGVLLWSGESETITIAAGENNLRIKMKKVEVELDFAYLLANKRINGVELLKTSEVVVLPKGESVTVTGDNNCYYLDNPYVNSGVFDGMRGVFISNREVTFTRAFVMGQFEVTQKLFKAVMGTNPSSFKDNPDDGEVQDLRPVENVNWYDAITFCNKLSILQGLQPCYSVSTVSDWEALVYDDIPKTSNEDWNAVVCDFDANGYRLPTEAEWEFAARGGDPTASEWGYAFAGKEVPNGSVSDSYKTSVGLGDFCWYNNDENSRTKKTHEVGKKLPNTLDLYDMSGNVREMCWDLYQNTVETGIVTNPVGASTASFFSKRASRGGYWGSYAYSCLVSYRDSDTQYTGNSYYGFRLCRTLTGD